MSDDDSTCPDCGTHFANAATLRKHVAAIHKKEPEPQAAPSAKRPRAAETREERGVNVNVELAPLLGVLSGEQKDALILRALQADPNFYDRLLEQASAPLTEEGAQARLTTLDGEGVLSAIRWFVTIGAAPNALTLLVAASQQCLVAIDDLAASLGGGGEREEGGEEGGGASSTIDEELVSAVEALPAAGAIGSLWCELLAVKRVRALLARTADEEVEGMRHVLEGMQAAAATVRPSMPGVLIGSKGETVDTLADAVGKLAGAVETGAAEEARGNGGKARKVGK